MSTVSVSSELKSDPVPQITFFELTASDLETFLTQYLSSDLFFQAHKKFYLKLFKDVVQALIYSNSLYFEKFIAPLEHDIKTTATSSSPVAEQGLVCQPQSFDRKGQCGYFFARSMFANVCASPEKKNEYREISRYCP